jgi:RsiW-degrading membrane proteinase PrsW (M82 family)
MVTALLRRLLVAAAVLAMVLSGLVLIAALGADAEPVVFLLAVGLAIAPVPLYLALLLRLDRYEPEPVRTVLFAFFWGATVACLVALVLNTLGSVIVGSSFGNDAAELYGGSISAPVVEETAKGAVIYGLYRWHRAEFDGVLDGIVYAGCVGLGFAMTENVLYYGEGAASEGLTGALATFVVRGLMAPFAHPLFTAATGIGLGLAARTSRRGVRVVAPWAGLAVAIGLHSLWNTTAGAGLFLGVYVLVMVPLFVAVLVIAAAARRREARIVRTQLPHYAAAGLLTPAEIEPLASPSERRRTRRVARRRAGPGAERALRDVQLAATELAFERDRALRGVNGDARAAAAREQRWAQTFASRRRDLQAALSA